MNDSGLGITKENLLLIVPPALTRDPAMMARAAADAEAMAARLAEIDRVRIISNIDGLDETVLDILARDFKVDWWDPEYSIEEKRRTLKGSWRVHKILGTKAAVETAIRAIYPLTTVEEWFEYGGEPYHFRLNIDITSDSGDRTRQKRVLERLNFYKSLRSHNDGVRYFLVPEKSWALAGGGFVGSREIDRAEIRVPPLKKPGGEVITIAGGGLVGSRSEGHVTIHIPPLQRPGGKTVTIAGGLFTGSYSRDHAAIRVPPLQQTGGSAAVSPAGALRGMYRRIHTAVDVPELARPRAAANRATATGFIGSVERVTVTVKTSTVKVSTGRAATGGAAGMFHSYQRIRVSIGSPATIISGR